jgi:hypothetical protein
MYMSKGRSGIGDRNIQGTHDDWDGLSMNGRQYRNAVTQEIRNLSGADYWFTRKADYPDQEPETWVNGKANIAAFKEAQTKPKAPAKKKSVLDSILLADRNYTRLCGLSEQLDTELDQGLIDLESWAAARRNIDNRLEKAWARVQRERCWDDQPEELPELSFSLEACTEQRRGFKIDYSVLSVDSVFSGLKDENLFKIGYTKLLTAMKWMAKIAATGKKVLEEGLV